MGRRIFKITLILTLSLYALILLLTVVINSIYNFSIWVRLGSGVSFLVILLMCFLLLLNIASILLHLKTIRLPHQPDSSALIDNNLRKIPEFLLNCNFIFGLISLLLFLTTSMVLLGHPGQQSRAMTWISVIIVILSLATLEEGRRLRKLKRKMLSEKFQMDISDFGED